MSENSLTSDPAGHDPAGHAGRWDGPPAQSRTRRWNPRRGSAALRPFVDRRFRVLLGVVGVAGITIGLTEALILRLIGELSSAIDGSVGSGTGDKFTIGPIDDIDLSALVAVGIGATFVLIVFRLAEITLITRLGIIPLNTARRRLADAYLTADHHTQQSMTAGEFQELMTAHTTRLGSMALATATFVSASLVAVSLAVAAAIVNFQALVVLGVLMVGVLAVVAPVHRLAQRLGRRQAAANTDLAKRTEEMVQASTEARVFGVSEALRQDHHSHVDRVGTLIARSNAVTFFGSSVFQALMLGVIVVLGGLLAARETGDFAAAGTVALIALRTQMAARQALTANLSIATSAPFAEELSERLDQFHASTQQHGSVSLQAVETLHLDDVWFGHPCHDPDAVVRLASGDAVLRGLELELSQGEHIGIVGASGSGKSTMIAILLGLREPDAGNYLINGVRRADYAEHSISRAVASVPQRPILISGTVAENVRFYRDIADDDVVRAAQSAGVHDEIVSWPDGYDTVIGERGARQVSGGQTQRIAFARALAGRPSLLVMDEPTSAIDDAGTKLVADTMAALDRTCAAVIVSHRVEALRSCDRVYEMVEGRLVELELPTPSTA